MGLSERQREITEFIVAYHRRHGYAPNQREIAGALGYQGVGGLHYQLNELKRLGYIEYKLNCPRTIRVLPKYAGEAAGAPEPDSEEAVMVPVLGRIAAGPPILAQEKTGIPCRCRRSSWGMATCSCSACAVTRCLTRRFWTATGWSSASKTMQTPGKPWPPSSRMRRPARARQRSRSSVIARAARGWMRAIRTTGRFPVTRRLFSE